MHIRASVLLVNDVLGTRLIAEEDFSHHDLIHGRIITWAANELCVKVALENNDTLWLEIEIAVRPDRSRVRLPRIRL